MALQTRPGGYFKNTLLMGSLWREMWGYIYTYGSAWSPKCGDTIAKECMQARNMFSIESQPHIPYDHCLCYENIFAIQITSYPNDRRTVIIAEVVIFFRRID